MARCCIAHSESYMSWSPDSYRLELFEFCNVLIIQTFSGTSLCFKAHFLGAFKKLREAAISFVILVTLSVCGH